MKLHYKINFTSMGILLVFACAIVIVGSRTITQITYDLHRRLMQKELSQLAGTIDSKVRKQSTVGDVPKYGHQAQADLIDTYKKYRFSETGMLTIVRKSDRVSLLNGPDWAHDRQAMFTMFKNTEGCLLRQFQGKERLLCFTNHNDLGWLLVLSEPTDTLLAVRQRYLATALRIIIVCLLIGGGFLFFFTNQIVHPIKDLTLAADAISKGNWQAPLPEGERADEIAHLSTSFRTMSKSLAASYTDVQENLEKLKTSQEILLREKEQLTLTLQSIGDGVIQTDTQGNVTLLNRVAEKLTGWPQDEAMGRSIKTIFHLLDSKGFPMDAVSAIARIQRGEKKLVYSNSKLVSRGGQQQDIALTGAGIVDSQGVTVGILFIIRDVAEQVRIQDEVLKSHKLESVGILAGGIAHDFNNLLTGILGNLSLAKCLVNTPEALQMRLDKAEQASLRAKELTSQLLTFSKGGEPIKKTMALENVLIESSSFALTGSNCKCIVAVPDTLWPIEGDEEQIGQVIHNLVTNAAQAMPNGGDIEVLAHNEIVAGKTALLLAPGSYVVITVKDTGSGIKKEVISRIFDPYFTTRENGRGLGLASAYSIITKHTGHIHAESEKGNGSVFTIYLPASENTLVPARDACPQPLVSGSGRVLIMDDEPVVQETTGQMLGSLGYTVEFADDGEDALAACEKALIDGQAFDLAIMDLTIPGGMGGKDALAEIRKIDPDLQAIVSSGYANDPVMARFQDYGFAAVLAKPFTLEQLSCTVQGVMAGGYSRSSAGMSALLSRLS